jgi:hypothetical protein
MVIAAATVTTTKSAPTQATVPIREPANDEFLPVQALPPISPHRVSTRKSLEAKADAPRLPPGQRPKR